MNEAVDAFLGHHFQFRPVDATFMGLAGHDHRMPAAGSGVLADEARGMDRLETLLDGVVSGPDGVGSWIDARIVRSEIALGRAALARPRLHNPAWYTGEAAFGVIGLLLPQSNPVDPEAVLARLESLPDFLADGRARLASASAPKSWSGRAVREAAALVEFLTNALPLHPAWDERWRAPASAAAAAARQFSAATADLPEGGFACGGEHLSTILREGHGIHEPLPELDRQAAAAFADLEREMAEMAARIDPSRGWREMIAGLSRLHPPSPAEVRDAYAHWHTRALEAGRHLVTPEQSYGLDFRPMSPWFQAAAKALYFLSYRCPPAGRAGAGSVYWVAAPGDDPAAYLAAQNTAAIKTTHAVHHGSIGHHTQNARARAASSRLARLGGTDCALGIAFLSAGTLIEGWACHAVDVMAEAPGFYTPEELLLLKYSERRNAASVLVDIRLHTGVWTQEEAAAFYRDEAGFPAARVAGEVTRNTMLPGTRLMYWCGVEAIRALRRRWRGDTPGFHDTLLGHGDVPVAWIGEEMERAGFLAP